MPHKPASNQYEPLDDYLSRRTRDEALMSKNWTDAQVNHIDDYYEGIEIGVTVGGNELVPKPPISKEESDRQKLIQISLQRKLTGPERRKLANLNRRLRSKSKRSKR